MRIAVTGGAGFIGSHLVERLASHGHRLLVIDDLSSGRLENLEGWHDAAIEVIDVRNSRAMYETLAPFIPEAVIHLAAQPSVAAAERNPIKDASVNIDGTVTVLEICELLTSVKRVILAASGGTLYGDQDLLPIDEGYRHEPMSAYGISKAAALAYFTYFIEQRHAFGGMALALGNVYGPRQDPNGEAGVISIFARQMTAGERPTIYGTGDQTRDFVYIDDVVNAFVAALLSDYRGGTVNIGSGKGTSVNEIFGMLKVYTSWRGEPLREAARQGEPRNVVLDTTKAKNLLGWRSFVKPPEGIKRTAKWISELPA